MLQVVEVGIHRSSWGKHCLLLPGSVSFCCLTHFVSGTLRQIPLGWLVETTGRFFAQHVLRAVQDLLHFFIPTRGMSSGQKHFSPGTSCSSSNSIPLLQILPPFSLHLEVKVSELNPQGKDSILKTCGGFVIILHFISNCFRPEGADERKVTETWPVFFIPDTASLGKETSRESHFRPLRCSLFCWPAFPTAPWQVTPSSGTPRPASAPRAS